MPPLLLFVVRTKSHKILEVIAGGYSCVCPYLATDRRACQHLHLCPRLIRGWRLHLHHRLICGWRLRLPLP
jgi:hypothetical protein